MESTRALALVQDLDLMPTHDLMPPLDLMPPHELASLAISCGELGQMKAMELSLMPPLGGTAWSKVPPLAVPELGSGVSSRRASWTWLVRYPRGGDTHP